MSTQTLQKWEETTLGNICDEVYGVIQTGPFGSQLHESDYSQDGIPVVMPKDIIDGKIQTENIARVSKEHVARLQKHKLKSGDIVYGRRGDIGRQALIGKEQEGWLCGTGCLKISLGDKIVNPRFLHYYLRDEEVINWIFNQAIGATMPNLNTAILRSVPIRIPDISTQTHVASVLSNYDDLVENNTHRIKILEQMAQAIYTEWFVNFHFPGHEKVKMVDSGTDFGKIPEGWEIKTIGETFGVHLGGTPSRSNSNYWGGNIPWINSGMVNMLRITEASEFITEDGLNHSATKLMPKRTTVIAITGATLGQVSLLEVESSANQSVVGIFDKANIYNEYIYLFIKAQIHSIISKAGGSAQQHINKGIIDNHSILIPSQDIISNFRAIITPIFDLLSNILFANKNLRQTRDLLLPKFVTGAIQV